MARTRTKTPTGSPIKGSPAKGSPAKRKSVSWEDFRRKTLGRSGWQVAAGVALYGASIGKSGQTQVRIAFAPNVLDHTNKRAELAAPDSRYPVEFEVMGVSKDGSEINDKTTLAAFSTEWTRLWRAGCCGRTAYVPPFRIMPAPTERMMRLKSLRFTEEQMRYYREREISRSPLGALFGQFAHRVADRANEANEAQSAESVDSAPCVFCEANSVHRYELAPEECGYLGVPASSTLTGCTECGRVLDGGTNGKPNDKTTEGR